MAEAEDQQPIIVIKKGGGHGGQHGGAWKVAYADFVTAMMAFFLVMWLVSQSDEVKQNVQGYFNDPGGWGKKGSDSILKGNDSILKGGASILKEQPTLSPPKSMNEQQAREVLKQAGDKISNALTSMPDFEAIKDHIDIELTEDGLRIELIEATSSESDSSFFFKSGSAVLSEKGSEILNSITKELSKLPNEIVIEGHTDSKQFVYKDKYSNWELSADRANSARKLMEANGLRDGQIAEIRGFAAKHPKIANNPQDPRNRRISIVVQNDTTGQYIDHMEMHEMIDGKVVKDISGN
jgi:chemotaxis protein MotB